MHKVVSLILAGGRVDELSVLTLHRPKSAVFFGGMYRVIDFPLSNLMNSGIERVGVLSQYRSTSLINHVGVGTSWDFAGRERGVTLLPPQQGSSHTDWYRGTADAVAQNHEFLEEYPHEHVLIVSGDHIYNMDYQKLVRFHEENDADVTAAFVPVPTEGAGRFGLGDIEGDDSEPGGPLVDYVEKPSRPLYNWASMTVYLFKRSVLSEILRTFAPAKGTFEFGRDVLPALMPRFKVFGWRHRGYWAYSRTIDEYWRANMDFLDGDGKLGFENWRLRTNLDDKRLRERSPAILTGESHVTDSRFTFGCHIAGRVERSILFPGVVVEAGAVVRDSILFPDAHVSAGAEVTKVIADEKVSIGAGARIGIGDDTRANSVHPNLLRSGITLIGKATRIPGSIEMGKNCIVPPFLDEEQFTESSYPAGMLVT